MAFVAISPAEIAAGEPVSASTQTKIKNNFDDLENRLEVIESGNTGDPPLIFRVNGRYIVLTGALKTTTNININIAGVRILVDKAGTSGTLQIDIKKKRGAGAYESIFSTLPSVDYTAGDDALSTNAVLDLTKVDLVAGDILRLDITSAQTNARSFLVRIDFTRA